MKNMKDLIKKNEENKTLIKTINFDSYEKQEQERFNNLPQEVRFQALEYYAYMKMLNRGDKLTREQMLHCAKLSAIVDEHEITTLCFEADVL